MNNNQLKQVRDFLIEVRENGCTKHEEMANELLAALSAAPETQEQPKPELTVWYGPMPESNGKSNFTATLMRKGADFFDTDQYTFARSEYPDRVRYEADFMRYLIGERTERPELWDKEYDHDKHSGYAAPVQPASKPEGELFGLALNVKHKKCHEAANAFWAYWEANGETHKRGYYESTWGAINAALKLVGVVPHTYGGTIPITRCNTSSKEAQS